MENASDALIMAGQVLVFIIALTVCISSFNTLRNNITDLIEQPETIKMTQDSEGYLNYVESRNSNSIRVVSAETVISSMYRAVKENYIVYIKLNNNSERNFQIEPNKELEGSNGKKYTIGDVTYTIGTDKKTVVMIKANEDLTIENTPLITNGDWLIKVTIGRKQEGINEKVNNLLEEDRFYDLIKNATFNEYLGEYQDGTQVSTENKLTKRIITYIETKPKTEI